MWVRCLVLALSAAWPVLACSCGSYEPVKACQIYQRTPVIFRGRVIDTNHDPTAGFGQMTLYRFKVLEAFKGIPADTKEVFIDPSSGISCYTTFAADRDYLVYTGRDEPAPKAATFFGRRGLNSSAKPPLAAWKGLEHLPVYYVGGCSPTRTVDENGADVAFLRSVATNGAQPDGWIEGRAIQNFSWSLRTAELAAAADAVLTVVSPSGERKTAPVEPDGRFKFGPVPPGVYAISAQSPALGKGTFLVTEVGVQAGGCIVLNASFESHASISGKVLTADGKPAIGTPLKFGELQADGKILPIAETWVKTGKDGSFKILNVPVGRIVLASNLNGAPTVEEPYDPVYAPGTQEITAARVFTLDPNQEMTGVVLRLPKPLPFGDLYVDVKWPNGSPAFGGARATAAWNGSRADFERAPDATNRVKLRLALGRKYDIRVDWLDDKHGRFLYVQDSEATTIDFMRDGQSLELPLKSKRPE